MPPTSSREMQISGQNMTVPKDLPKIGDYCVKKLAGMKNYLTSLLPCTHSIFGKPDVIIDLEWVLR